MIIGIGIDIIEIARIEKALASERFIARVFTDSERAYCELRPRHRSAAYAVRFAAKEAVMKALGCGWSGGNWRDIEVVRPAEGAPTIALHGLYLKESEKLGVQKIFLSLSHSETMGTAQVIVCQN